MKRVTILAVLTGCTTQTATNNPGSVADRPSDLVKECRMNEMQSITELSDAMNRGCDRPTLPLAIMMFDSGVGAGKLDADRRVAVQERLCLCAHTPCTDEQRMKILADVQKVMIDDSGRLERDGVSGLLESTAKSPCLNAEAATLIYRAGFRCGAIAIMRKESATELEDFAEILHDQTQASAIVDACAKDSAGSGS